MQLIFFGDSDISRWSESQYPSPSCVQFQEVINYGKGGAILKDLCKQIDKWKSEQKNWRNKDCMQLFVCCAGENDIGCGRSMMQISESFRVFLDMLFPTENNKSSSSKSKATQSSSSSSLHDNNDNKNAKMIFLGPKFEPWLTDDKSSREQYTQLNTALQTVIRNHPASSHIKYVDCLTIFCTEDTANIPGAVYGHKAMPDTTYFDEDGLHLNDAGYDVWKEIVEDEIDDGNGMKG